MPAVRGRRQPTCSTRAAFLCCETRCGETAQQAEPREIVTDATKPAGFVSLKSVTGGRPDAATALAEIREIYFQTTKRTIDNDLAHAIALVKSLPDEETRAKAHVYMEGLAEMAREWGKTSGTVEKWKGGKGRKAGKERRRPRKPQP